MFNSDKPITKIEDDVLNRGNFSKQLAHAILAYTKTDNFVISLCGRWGSGKTSILNMVLDEIEKNVQPNTDDTPIIVKFNPWNYSDSSQLINQFFGVMLATLKSKCGGEKFKVLGNILEKYSSFFNYTQYIPVSKDNKYIILGNPATVLINWKIALICELFNLSMSSITTINLWF